MSSNKNIITLIFFALMLQSCTSLFMSKSYKDQLSSNKINLNDEVDFLELKSSDTLTDIGAQTGLIEAYYSVIIDNLHFNLLDTDEKSLTPKNIYNTNKIIKRLYHNNHHYSYDIYLNTNEKLPLPSFYCSKILCRKTVHEFTHSDDMINEIYRVLHPNGELYIIETNPKTLNQTDSICHFKLLPSDSIISMFSRHGFVLKKKKLSENKFNFFCFRKEG